MCPFAFQRFRKVQEYSGLSLLTPTPLHIGCLLLGGATQPLSLAIRHYPCSGCPIRMLRKDEFMKSLSTTSPEETLAASQEKESVRRVRQRTFRTTLVFWTFVGPLILGLLVFFFIPIIWSIILSFAAARATITPSQFVGLQNYREMLGDPDFVKALTTFTIFAVFIVPTTFIFALGLAL